MILPAALAWSAWFAPMPPLGTMASLQDTSALRFAGITAGAALQEISSQVRRRRGQLRCDQARTDHLVRECRGTLPDSGGVVALAIWVSAIDSTAGVITLSASVDGATLRKWRDGLTRRYGPVQTATQGSQKMMQWVRRGRMLRLTWRPEGDGTTASISLVDGHVLDGWGHGRDTASKP
jgi:hypothetical protein